MFVTICFDISSDRTRRQATRVLEAYATRVQKSVFECRIAERQFVELRQRMSQIGLAEGDLVRYYTLCRACERKIEFTGGSPPQDEKDHLIV